MTGFLIDENLPYRFSLWASSQHIHVKDLQGIKTDSQIWDYAQQNHLTIISKDADFSERVLLTEPPPRVIHIRLGNLKMREFHQRLTTIWSDVCELSLKYKLVNVFTDRIEGID